jgi:Cof subfamily protein (haloacid dehalogenase superfamily)
MIELIASDMDGTLVNDEGKINENVFKLIDSLYNKNIKFAAASGRFYSQLCKNFDKVKWNMLLIAHNGALIKYKNDEKTIFSSHIQKKYINEVINLRRDFGEEVLIAVENNALIVNPTEKVKKTFEGYKIPIKICSSYEEIKEPVYRITYYNPEGVKDETLKYLKDNLNPDLEFVVSGKRWIDIMNKGTSKGNAIKILQNKFNIKEENTMVFGDSYNDIPMFQAAHFSYAMKNAPDDVKDKAKFIAENNNKNGVYNVIHEYVLSI